MKSFTELIKGTLKSFIIGPREVNIPYDLSTNYFTYYNEASGVAKKRRSLLKNPSAKTHSHAFYSCWYLGLTIIIELIYIYACLNYPESCFTYFLELFLPFLYVLLCLYFAFYLSHLLLAKTTKKKGTITLSKEGLTNTIDDLKITFPWSKIKMFVLKENTIIILTSTPIYFFANKEITNSLISNTKRFKPDITIVK